MEWLVAFLIEVVFQFLGELIYTLVIAPLFELLLGRRAFHGFIGAFNFLFLGVAIGFLSVWLFPHHLINVHWLRLLNLIATPILVGACMMVFWMKRRGPAPLEAFIPAWIFAFVFAGSRFVLAK